MRRQEHPSKRFVHKARPSHGEVVQANGVDTRPYLLRAEEQGRGIVKKARPSTEQWRLETRERRRAETREKGKVEHCHKGC
nr:hypothetical protein CFP56_18556 [Quercus suber]